MEERTAQLLAAVRDAGAPTRPAGQAWRELFEHDRVVAVSAAFDLLAGEPRIKPSRGLVVDPGDTARRRWELRVAAAAALLASPAAGQVFDELRDELAEDPDLAAAALTASMPSPALTRGQLSALHSLGPPAADDHASTSPS